MRPEDVIEQDLQTIFSGLEPAWGGLAGARIFMTGGTGFIGRWMLESLRDADRRLGLNCHVTVLTRDPDAFAVKAPHLVHDMGVRLIKGDVLGLEPTAMGYSHVIHAATDASAYLNESDPRRMFDTVVAGTRRALEFAVSQGSPRFFFLSSGAVYGSQPMDLTHVGEEYLGGPDPCDPRAAYAEGKRAAEMLCSIYNKQFGLDFVNARIFALLGPLLSLDIHFAAGNFIRDAMAGQIVRVQSAGTAVRSYLYSADLTIWLWSILLRAPTKAVYNVGSEAEISIADLSRKTAAVLESPGAEILGQTDPGWNPGRYVPSTALIRSDLGLEMLTDLNEAIRRTAIWNGWKR